MSSIVRSILPEHRSEESQETETETEITASEDPEEADVPIKPFGQSKDSILVTHHQHRHDSHRTAATASPSEDSMSPSDNFREDQQGDRIKSRLDAVNENNKGAFLRMGSMVGSVTDKIRQHMVQFTRVNIHKHRMTLGNHPEGEQKMSRKKASSLFPVNWHCVCDVLSTAKGVPVTLRWSTVESEEIDFEAYQATSSERQLHVLPKTKRDLIALEHHSRKSIQQVEAEMKEIRQNRASGRLEDIRRAEHKEEQERRRQQSIVGKVFRPFRKSGTKRKG